MQLILAVTQTIIFLFSYWFVVCFYVLLLHYANAHPNNSSSLPVVVYCFLELAFYLQQEFELARLRLAHFPISKLEDAERRDIFNEVVIMGDMPLQQRIGEFTGWFMWKQSRERLKANELPFISQESVKQWLAWAFFGLDYTPGNPDSIDDLAHARIMEMIESLERALGTRFSPGCDAALEYLPTTAAL